jgi:hypothetical protein
MRRIVIVAFSAALLTTTAWMVHSTAAGSTHPAATTAPAAATTGPPTDEHTLERGLPTPPPASLASQLATARLATARYATSLPAATADGYQLITPMLPDMGWHFRNPAIQGFDLTRPPILVYAHRGNAWQLGALEWVFTHPPATPPLPGATYGSFAAACHYHDGTFVAATSQDRCANPSPTTGARFNFWHPDLVTLHLWLWYPNPAGLYSPTNPLIRPFNRG